MKRLSKSLILLALACSVLGLTGCGSDDPTELELEIGKNIDITRIEGRVERIGTSYFVGDRVCTVEMKGQPYYWVDICHTAPGSNYVITTTFKGIPVEVRDSLSSGMKLPGPNCLKIEQLANIHGEIIDMDRNVEENSFWIVVRDSNSLVRSYKVDKTTFYTLKDLEVRKLPLILSDFPDANL